MEQYEATEGGILVPQAKAWSALSPVDNRGGWYPIIRESEAGAWQRNIEISVDSVLSYHAVYACITLISADIGKLPIGLVEQDDDGIWSPTFSPAFSPVLKKPNRYQNHIQFKEWWITSKLIRGNSYALKQRDARGVVVALYLLDPCRVTVLVAPDGSVFYQLSEDNLSGIEAGVTVPASEIIHDRMNCLYHPLVGLSPIFASGLPATQGLKIQNNSTRFFQNMSRPSGILTAPGAISDSTAARLKEHWETNYGGENFGKVAVLGDALKYEPISVTAQESQMIEQLKWTAEVICSTFHVPPFKIGIGQMPTYQNAEVLNQIYYTDCLQSLIESMELCLDEGLGLDRVPGRTIGVELDLSVLLRMDQQTHIKTLAEGVKAGIMSPNESRKRLDLKPVKGGDTPYLQQQNYSLAALDEREKQSPLVVAQPAPQPAPVEEDEEPEEDEVRAFMEHLLKGLELETA